VDISVNPGDGGWGVILDLQGYKQLGRFTTFSSGTWLANPRDTAAATRGTLVTATATNSARYRTSSCSAPARPSPSPSTSGLDRVAHGRRARKILGDSHGFRRPGVEM
jgi:hypothetical protein